MPSFVFEVIKNLFKKPFTKRFPKEKLFVDKNVRGKLHYNQETCVKCKMCVKVCPANALWFNEEKNRVEGDRGICIYCGDCQRVCPTNPKSIYFTNEVQNAVYDRKELRL